MHKFNLSNIVLSLRIKKWITSLVIALLSFIIAFIAITANIELRRIIAESNRIELSLIRLQGLAHSLSAVEWRVIAQQEMFSEDQEDVQNINEEMNQVMGILEQLDPTSEYMSPVRQTYTVYHSAIDEEFRLIAAGNIAQAKLLDAGQVDPAFDVLAQTLVSTNTVYQSKSNQMGLVANIGSIAVPLLATAAFIMMLWLLQKAQAAIARNKTQLLVEEQTRRAELAALYGFASALARTDDLNAILELITFTAVQILNITIARLVLIEGGALVTRAEHPIRVLERDLQVGQKVPLEAQPFIQQVLAGNMPIVVLADDARVTAVERGYLLFDILQSACLVPLHISTTSLGFLLLGEARRGERETFTVDKLRLARNISDQASSALHRALLHQQTEKLIQQLSALHQIDIAISSSTDLRLSLNTLVDQAARLLRADAVDILLYDPATLNLKYEVGLGFRVGAKTHTHLRLGQGLAGRAALEGRTILLPDLVHAMNLAHVDLIEGDEFVSYFGTPMVAKGQIKGVLEVFQRTPFDPDQHWVDFFETLAQQAAIATESAQSFAGLQRNALDLALAYDDTLEGWARALDLRDQETEGHSQRVTEMTLQLSRAMVGLDEGEITHIRRGALLHDIGKMGIPDAILLKPGKLTDEEWKIMRQHPQLAFDVLKSIVYLHPALDIPFCHHEKWDGSGYPRGLKGGEIPLAARIFAVVDVYDALRSDRPYRKAWPEEKVIEHIKAGSGTHFDPKVVELFFRTSK